MPLLLGWGEEIDLFGVCTVETAFLILLSSLLILLSTLLLLSTLHTLLWWSCFKVAT